MKTKLNLTASAVAVLINLAAGAQTLSGNTGTWFTVLNRIQFAKHWSFTNEVHERTGKFLDVQGQFLVRPSIDFHVNKQVEFSVGYSFVRVSPYEPYTQPITRNEHNIWEQMILKNEVGRVNFLHRFRLENRWVDRIVTNASGGHSIDGSTYANRFRYRFNVSVDIVKFGSSGKSLFFNGFDELWIGQNNYLLPVDFARNWLYLGLGYKFDQLTNVQAGFMHQYDKTGATGFISTPIVQFTFVKNFDWTKEKE